MADGYCVIRPDADADEACFAIAYLGFGGIGCGWQMAIDRVKGEIRREAEDAEWDRLVNEGVWNPDGPSESK
jgi:hypothetical protein